MNGNNPPEQDTPAAGAAELAPSEPTASTPAEGHRPPETPAAGGQHADAEAAAEKERTRAAAAERAKLHRQRKAALKAIQEAKTPEEMTKAMAALAKEHGVQLPAPKPQKPDAPAPAALEQAAPKETFMISGGRPGWPSDQRIMAAGDMAAQVTAAIEHLVQLVETVTGIRFEMSKPREYRMGGRVFRAGGPDALFQAFSAYFAQFDVATLGETPGGNLLLALGLGLGVPVVEWAGPKVVGLFSGGGGKP